MASSTSFSPVRWGILGTASIALREVIPAMQQCAECDVVAIGSRDGEKARDAAKALHIPIAHDSYDALLADTTVEAVYIPLPNYLHVPWAIRAAQAGKHVLCEKPIALNAQEAQSLVAARDRAGVQIAEAFMVRTHPQWLEAKRIAAADALAPCALFRATSATSDAIHMTCAAIPNGAAVRYSTLVVISP